MNPSPPKRFSCEHRVIYSECTVGDHIYYARYLDILEEARGAFFRHMGVPFLQLQADDAIFPVIEVRVVYKSYARYDDVLSIELWPTAIQSVRLNFAYAVHNQSGALILQAETKHVCTTVDGKPRKLPETLVEKLTPQLHPA